jgi:hypothetical protein
MTIDDIEELIRKYLSTGIAAVVILVAPGTDAGDLPSGSQVITVEPGRPADTGSHSSPGSDTSGGDTAGRDTSSQDTSSQDTSGDRTGAAGIDPGASRGSDDDDAGASGASGDRDGGKKDGADDGQGADGSRDADRSGGSTESGDDGGGSDTGNADGNRTDNPKSGTGSDSHSGSGSHSDSDSGTDSDSNSGSGSHSDSDSHSGSGSGSTSSPGGTDERSGGSDEAGNADAPSRPEANGSTGTGDAGQSGAAASAAAKFGWGTPDREDDFSAGTDQWSIYDGPGHAGQGTRSPSAVSVDGGVLTITGDSSGTTAGMAWNPGQKYGRWEGRVKAPASDPSYNALLLLWPDAENFPEGGEVDFMEMMDASRQETNMFLHYGADNSQVNGTVQIDATQWHNWALEWTPEAITAYVDGEEWFRTTDTGILPPGPMHLCIQLDWFPKGDSPKESTMQVDWVRQYSLNPGSGGSTQQPGRSDDKPAGRNDNGGSDDTHSDNTDGDNTDSEQESPVRDMVRRLFSW